MTFNPLKEKGTPIEKQYRNWKNLNVKPYDKRDIHPYSKTRLILMNGVEIESTMFKHQMARHCPDLEVKRQLAASRRVEQMQQKMVNWFSPGDETQLETTIGFEQVAVDLTAWLAKNEPDPNVKKALDYALLEDFDHLYRYANLLNMTKNGSKAHELVGEYTEIFPGRPTAKEHIHPYDSIKKPVDNKKADIRTLLNILIIVSGEQQTMNFYMNIGNTWEDMLGRGLYQEIAMVEEEHVTHYESLADPTASWWERLLLHEYMECYLYYSFIHDETDPRLKKYWEEMLHDEIEHLKMSAELFKKHEKRDVEELLPEDMPKLLKFESNKEYVRQILKEQIDLTADKTGYKEVSKLPENHTYLQYQDMVNKGIDVPSEEVIKAHEKKMKCEYRLETEGLHPVERFRSKEVCKI
jgi:rubrerythrin